MKKGLLFLSILTFTFIFISSCSEEKSTTPTQETINLDGKLLDNDGYQLPNAIIYLTEISSTGLSNILASDTTDENGDFDFSDIEGVKSNLKLIIEHDLYPEHQINYLDFEQNTTYSLEEDEDCCGKLKVSVSKGNEGINEAKVQLRKNGKVLRKTYTDSEGIVEFTGLCLQEYEIRIVKDGYKVIEKMYEVDDCDDTHEYSAELESKEDEDCCNGVMTFTPKDKDGNVINGAKIILYKDGKAIEDPVVKEGKAVIDGLCEGKYTVVIKAEGYKEIEFNVELGCNQEKNISETLTKKEDEDCCGILQVQVKDENGNPVNEAKVQVRQEGKELKYAYTNSDGYVKFEDLCLEVYELRISRDGYKVIEKEVEIENCEEETEVSYTLESEGDDCCKGVLIFTPKDKDGNVINGAKIILYKDGKAIEDPVVKEGKAVIDGLCEGKYTVVIKAEGYKDIEFNVELGCNQEKNISETLTKNEDEDCCEAILKFITKDKETEKAISGAKITLILDGKTIAENQETNNDGIKIIKELCKGEYTVVIKKDGYKTIETKWNVEKCDDFQEHFWMEKE